MAFKTQNLIILGLMFFIGPSFILKAYAFVCPIDALNIAKADIKAGQTIRERIELKKDLRSLYSDIATILFQEYRSQNSEEINHCLNNINDKKLTNITSWMFKENLLEDLKNTKSKTFKLMLQRIFEEKENLMIGASFDFEDSSKRPASYHRTAKNILINFAKLNYNEAKLILVHELTHKADEEVLFKASVDFSNEDRQKEIYNFASQNVPYENLQNNEKTVLDQFLFDGLKRGFLAEFKAWALSYRIYQEMKDVGEIKEISWTESILELKNEENSYLDFIFNYYRPRFVRPERLESNLFYWDTTQEGYDSMMKMLNRQNKCELLDDLIFYFEEC